MAGLPVGGAACSDGGRVPADDGGAPAPGHRGRCCRCASSPWRAPTDARRYRVLGAGDGGCSRGRSGPDDVCACAYINGAATGAAARERCLVAASGRHAAEPGPQPSPYNNYIENDRNRLIGRCRMGVRSRPSLLAAVQSSSALSSWSAGYASCTEAHRPGGVKSNTTTRTNFLWLGRRARFGPPAAPADIYTYVPHQRVGAPLASVLCRRYTLP